MHILVTDVLVCPRCGPGFGLILLADTLEERRVVEGRLGCANCRNSYPVRGAVADLRLGGSGAAGGLVPLDGERAFRIAALSGLSGRPGTVLVRGAEPALAAGVADLLPDALVVAASSAPPAGALPGTVSWVLEEGTLPFRDRSLAAVALLGPPDERTLAGARRVLLPGARLVVEGTTPETVPSLVAGGWTVHLEQDDVAVASYHPRG